MLFEANQCLKHVLLQTGVGTELQNKEILGLFLSFGSIYFAL